MRPDSDRVADMLDAIAAIERRKPQTKVAFDADEMVQVWMLRHIQIIGEAAAGITQDTRALAPGIPWGQIVGMRNALVHAYFNIDWDAVWLVVIRDLPKLEPELRALTAALSQHENATGTTPPTE
jgi:uncharacterized protein with HEPN domain